MRWILMDEGQYYPGICLPLLQQLGWSEVGDNTQNQMG